MVVDRSPQPKCAYSVSGDLQRNDIGDSSGSYIEEPRVLSGDFVRMGQSSSVRASWPRRTPMNMPSDVVYMPSQKKRWSVASCSSQSSSAVPFRCLLITLSQIEDQRGVEYTPYISAHHYDSVYRSSPGYGESDLCRYSLPNRRSSRYLTSQESDEASILPKRTCFSIAFPLASYSVAPTMFDGNGNYPEELFNLSSTPESPVNSSLDYKASIQDDPTIFHRGGGRRGGIRLGSGNLQDLSLLTMKPGETKTPLSSRSSLSHHRGQSPVSPTSRIHHLSLTKGLSSPMRAALEEDEALGDYVNSMVRMRRQFSDSAAVPNPVMSSSMSSSMNPVMNPVMSSSMNPCVNSMNQTMNPSMNPSMNSSMNQTITQPINPRINPSRQPRSPSLPFPNPQSPTSEEESLLPVPEPLQMSIHYDGAITFSLSRRYRKPPARSPRPLLQVRLFPALHPDDLQRLRPEPQRSPQRTAVLRLSEHRQVQAGRGG